MIGLMGAIGPIGLMRLIGPMRPMRLIGPMGLIGLMALMGCSSEETIRTVESTMRPIAFADAYTAQPTRSSKAYTAQPTRSSEAFTAIKGIPTGQSMGIYAYLHDATGAATRDYTTCSPNFMWNQQATSQEEEEPFTYSPLKYWPNDEDSKLSFIAYFPYTEETPGHTESPAYPDNATGLRTLLTNSGTGLPTFLFTVKDEVADQVDFLVSQVAANLPQSRDTEDNPHLPFNDLTITDRVPFVFMHMTAKVEFRIVADAEIRKDIVSFHLNTLNITNIFKDGKLTPSYAPATGETSYAWSNQATKQDYPFTTYEPQLLMPQVIAADAMINLDYEITFKSDGTTYHYVDGVPVADQDYTYSNTASIALKEMKLTGTDTPLEEWLPNHHYIYNIRLRANRIDFTGQVVEWGDTQDIEGIDIKDE